MYQPAVLFFPDRIDLLDLLNDLFIMRKYIAGFNVGRAILLQKQEGISDTQETIEDRLLLRIKRKRNSGGFHNG